MASKYVYFFGGGKAEGKASMKESLGGKGANLAEMTNLGLPVPPGFTISAECCDLFSESGGKWPKGLDKEVEKNLKKLEKAMKRTFGGDKKPLLVSVRSGAAISMPGMMDTVLNLGLNEGSLQAMVEEAGDDRFAWDAYRRLVQMFGDVVMDVPKETFDHAMEGLKEEKGAALDTDLTTDDLKELVKRFKHVYEKHTGEGFPDDPREQLKKAIDAVFGSWNNKRAITYRKINKITGLKGTAVNVQAMVFGNMGAGSGTGVAFTRSPSNGENEFFGEYLMNAQGEDVVAGIRTPLPISTLEQEDPKSYKELMEIRGKLEEHYRDMQDVEFTIQQGTLYMLQTRTGKRTIFAALRAAVEMCEEGLITEEEAVARIPAGELPKLFSPVLDPAEKASAESSGRMIATGLPASPGGATGRVVFTADDAEAWAARGEKVILARTETSPEDVGGMAVAQAILTSRGGMTSHAAVVARGMGVPCVAGAGELLIDYGTKRMRVAGRTIAEGDAVSLDVFEGKVYAGDMNVQPSEIVQVQDGTIATEDSQLFEQYNKLMGWADGLRRLGVRANADTPRDASRAVKMGAEGIGLTRTEHMFFEGDRIVSFRKFILVADTVRALRAQIEDERDGEKRSALERKLADPLQRYNEALNELLPLQRGDFEGIFEVMDGKPVTIRTLDPPLHEFLPQEEKSQQEMAKALWVDVQEVKDVVEKLHELNPMLGLRGCRLGIIYPEVTAVQVRAIIEAAINVQQKGVKVEPEIMIPLVGKAEELKLQRELAEEVIDKVCKEKGVDKKSIDYKIGTMIEIPRAAVTADEVAEYAEFFSFGTNDLTQMGCGFSRDDAGKFLGEYKRVGVYDEDPFEVLDQGGVGKMVEMACRLGREARPGIKLGICGEHGGEPASVKFCHRVGLTYVSCSPYRVPVARLSAAQAVIEEKGAKPKAKGKAKRARGSAKKAAGSKARRKPSRKKKR